MRNCAKWVGDFILQLTMGDFLFHKIFPHARKDSCISDFKWAVSFVYEDRKRNDSFYNGPLYMHATNNKLSIHGSHCSYKEKEKNDKNGY